MSTPEIAITGYAARLPGAKTTSQAWSVLQDGRCTVGPWDSSRWSSERFFHPDPRAAGYTYAQRAGLLSDIWSFDNLAFGISAREAAQMDPQQRILLEVCAEAIAAAGLSGPEWDRSRTGVYVGASSSDHAMSFSGDIAAVEEHFMLGNTLSIMSNRLSFHFDLTGPSYTVDTACSSSFYALDQAAKALNAGEIDTAIVGGVNVLLSPLPFVGFSRATMLSPDGLCKAFDENANGYVRSEGAVVFVLRRLDHAQEAQDRVRGILVGTGVNSDGRTVGMSLPSGDRQADLMRSVLDKTKVSIDDVAFVEAHGTGTAVGDPEEAGAIGAVYGQTRANPLVLGSAKSNFGHLEPVSGLVGLLKSQLALEHNHCPATLHVDALNPAIPFDDLNLDVATSARDLPRSAKPWHAAINSFGFGGANAHVIIRQPRKSELARASGDLPRPNAIVLSAHSSEVLEAKAGQWAKHLTALDDITAAQHVNSANHRLDWHSHRLVVQSSGVDGLTQELARFADGEAGPAISTGKALGKGKALAFAFSGNGSQWDGMGREQFVNNMTFRASFEETNAIFKELGCSDLKQLLFSPTLGDALRSAPVAQPVLFAVQLATVDMLAKQGVRPCAVVGHSVGEVAAATVAGALSRADAITLVYRRSLALDQLFDAGTMAAVASDHDTLSELLAGFEGEVSLAGVNSPKSCTISGPTDAIKDFLRFAKTRRIAGKTLDIPYPYHSHLVEPLKQTLLDDLAYLKPRASDIPIYSSTNGALIAGEAMDQEYWWRNARDAVQFCDAAQAMMAETSALVAEISAKPVLRTYLRDVAEQAGVTHGYVATLDERNAARRSADKIAAEAIILGADVDRSALIGEAGPFSGDLPPLIWDEKQHRVPFERDRMDIFSTQPHHPLLGGRLRLGDTTWSAKIDTERLPWLKDHKVLGRVLFPATGYLEICLAVAAAVLPDQAVEIDDLDIQRPIALDGGKRVELRTSYTQQSHRVIIEYRPADSSQPWSLAAQAVIWPKVRELSAPEAADEGAEAVDPLALYAGLSGLGYEYGPAFSKLETLAITDERAQVALGASEAASPMLRLDPTLADAALHGTLAILERRNALSVASDLRFLPTRIGRCVIGAKAAPIATAEIAIKSLRSTSVVIDVTFMDQSGDVVAQLERLSLAAVPFAMGGGVDARWRTVKVPVGTPPAHSLAAKVWPDASAALSKLGVTAEDFPEPDDGALLLEAIAHRHAWDLIVQNEGRAVSTSKKLRAASAALVTADAAEWDAEARRLELLDECPWPDAGLLIDALVRTAPDRAEDLQTTLRALKGEPRDGQKTPAALWRAAQTALSGFHAEMPATPLGARLLVLGRPDAAFLDHVIGLDGFGAVTFACAEQSEADALKASLNIPDQIAVVALGEIEAAQEFDVIVGVDCLRSLKRDALAKLAGHLVAMGHFIGLEQEPTPYDTLIASAEGLRRDEVEELAARLVDAGLQNLESAPFAGSEVLASVLSARGAAAAGEETQERPLSVAVIGESDAATRLREALPNAGVIVKPVADTAVHFVTGTYGAPDEKGEMTRLARDLAEMLDIKAKRLWVICDASLSSAAYSGFVRVLANERQEMQVTLVRLEADAGGDFAPQLADVISKGSQEPELVLSEDGVAALRVQKYDDRAEVAGDATALMLGQRRTLEDLTWTPVERRAPEAGEVEIEVVATGLNFRDVMWAQGLLPPEALEEGFAGATLGMECAGRVLRAGKDSQYSVGDPVIAFSPQAFASHITVGDAAVAGMPEGVALDQAAALPTAFFTSVYSLHEVARIRAGEIVLIHGGAGGVGLAALQVAKAVGAKVFATAGSTWKRELLTSLGVDAVFDSRSLTFADDVMRQTDGRGVDVVLNSLAGLAMEQSIKCLAKFGRFIELGKKDYYANTPIGLRDLRRNIAYHGVDVDQLLAGRAEVAASIMDQISAGFANEDYYLPPVEMFEPADVHSAFRLMQKSGHIGKIVVKAPRANVAKPVAKKVAIKGAWLVIGGASGFGLESAKWLAENGAEALWLVSRSAEPLGEALSVPVEVRKGDATKAADMQAILDEIAKSDVPLSGVLHAAMVLDDGLLADQTPERLSKVMTPKIAGAAVLDRLTRAYPLDHFVMYSSVTTLFGNPGQAGYVAANCWLEALAEQRRGDGLPGQAIAWGPISDAGYLTRTDTLSETLKMQLGGEMLDTAGALRALGDILRGDASTPVEVVAPVKWGRLAKDLALVRSPMFAHVDTSNDAIAGAEMIDVAEIVRTQGAAAAQKKLLDVLRTQAGEILRQPKAEVDPGKPLMEMGFDSLLAVSLRMTVEERFGLEIPQVAISESLTLRDLARQMVAESGADSAQTGAAVDADRIATLNKHVDAKGGLDVEVLNSIEQAALEVKSLTGDKRK